MKFYLYKNMLSKFVQYLDLEMINAARQTHTYIDTEFPHPTLHFVQGTHRSRRKMDRVNTETIIVVNSLWRNGHCA
jgi:hypothetical protein